LWQGRFGSVVTDEEHLANAIRYVSLNPVRARLVEQVQEWPRSGANAHLSGSDDELVTVAPVLERYGDFAAFLDQEEKATAFSMLRQPETTGRPVGSDKWIEKLEKLTARVSLNWIQAAIATSFKPDSYSANNIGLPVRI